MKFFTPFVVSVLTAFVFTTPAYSQSTDSSLVAEQSVVSGFVRYPSGDPIRGALVRVRDGSSSIARYTDANGAFEITGVPSKTLTVSASGWGLSEESKQVDAASKVSVNFTLKDQFSPLDLTSAEIRSTLPDNDETRWIEIRCISCHGLTQVGHVRGIPTQGWIEIFKVMQLSYGRDELTPDDFEYTAEIVAKYFGPTGPFPGPGSIERTPISDEVLKATFYLVDIPSTNGRTLPHSIVTDNKNGAWVAEYGRPGNDVVHWDRNDGSLKSMPMDETYVGPHTPTVARDGKIWTTLLTGGSLAVINPDSEEIIEKIPMQAYAHTLSTAADGKIWGSGQNIFRVDPETKVVQYWPLVSAERDAESWGAQFPTPYKRKDNGAYPLGPYHVVADSKGNAWATSYDTGKLIKLDPNTGKQTVYDPPNNHSSRGIDVDANDIVWFSNWSDNALMKFDPESEEFTKYDFPTPHSKPYSVFVDDTRGYVWAAGYTANNLARFDPRTETFVEYPLPNNQSYPRFISIDDQGRIWFAEWWNSNLGMMDPGY